MLRARRLTFPPSVTASAAALPQDVAGDADVRRCHHPLLPAQLRPKSGGEPGHDASIVRGIN